MPQKELTYEEALDYLNKLPPDMKRKVLAGLDPEVKKEIASKVRDNSLSIDQAAAYLASDEFKNASQQRREEILEGLRKRVGGDVSKVDLLKKSSELEGIPQTQIGQLWKSANEPLLKTGLVQDPRIEEDIRNTRKNEDPKAAAKRVFDVGLKRDALAIAENTTSPLSIGTMGLGSIASDLPIIGKLLRLANLGQGARGGYEAGKQLLEKGIPKSPEDTASMLNNLANASMGATSLVRGRGSELDRRRALTTFIGPQGENVNVPKEIIEPILGELSQSAKSLNIQQKHFNGENGPKVVVKVAQNALAGLEKQYDGIKKPFRNRVVYAGPVAKAVKDSISRYNKDFDPSLAFEIYSDSAMKFQRPISIQRLDQYRKDLNAELNEYYNKSAEGQRVATSKIEKSSRPLSAIVAERDAVSDLLYDSLQKFTGQDLRPLKQKQGALIEFKQAATSKINKGATLEDIFQGKGFLSRFMGSLESGIDPLSQHTQRHAAIKAVTQRAPEKSLNKLASLGVTGYKTGPFQKTSVLPDRGLQFIKRYAPFAQSVATGTDEAQKQAHRNYIIQQLAQGVSQ